MANANYTIDLAPSVDTPDRTVTVDGEEYPVSEVGRVAPGDDLTVTVTAPSTEDYQIQIRDSDKDIYRASDEQTGDATVTFETGPIEKHDALDPRSYGVAAVDSGDIEAFDPLVVIAYRLSVTVPRVAEAGDSFEVVAEATPLESLETIPNIQEVELVIWDDSGEDRFLMEPQGDRVYRKSLSRTAETYKVAIIVKSEEELDENEYEPVGFSDPRPITVKEPSEFRAPDWSVPTEGRMQFSRPAVSSSRVFIGGLGPSITARSLSSEGDSIWALQRAGALSDSSPVLAGGTIYVGSGGGVLYALDAETDSVTIEWKRGFESALTATPVVSDGVVYTGANDGQVHALDTSDGSLSWSTGVGGPVYAALAANDTHVFCTTAGGDIVALAHDGTESWRRSTGVETGSGSPVLDSGTLYVATDNLLALDPTTGSVRWECTEYNGTVDSTPAVDGETVYVGDRRGAVVAIDASSGGAVRWRVGVGTGVASQPTIVGSTVVVCGLNGVMLVLDAGTGSLVSSAIHENPIRSPLVGAGGDVYVGTEGASVFVYEGVG